MEEERRFYPRLKAGWSVSMTTSRGPMEGKIEDLSAGGAFICCDQPLDPKETLTLSFQPPNTSQLQLSAQVTWSNLNGITEKKPKQGMGVRFV